MSVTALDQVASTKTLEDAGFTEVQIAALCEFTDQSIAFRGVTSGRRVSEARLTREAERAVGGTIFHALAMLVLALAGLGALVAVLIRVA